MFKRWIKLLVVLLLISGGIFWHHKRQFDQAYVTMGACTEYLETQDDSWTSAGDTYFFETCETNNSVSDYSLALQQRDYASSWMNIFLSTHFFILTVTFLSFLLRWLVVGRVWS